MSDACLLPSFADLKIKPRTNAWGPTGIPEEFKNMPFQPFSKETRLGKIADWSGCVYQDNKSKNRYTSQFGGGGQYSYYHDEDDVNFQTVSSAKLVKNNYIRNRQRFLNIKNRKMSNSNSQQYQMKKKMDQRMPQNNRKMPPHMNNFNKSKMAYNRPDPRNQKSRVNRAPSISVKDHWLQVDEIELSRLKKLNLPSVKPPCDAGDFGFLEFYDPGCDSISVKNEQKLCDQHCESQSCDLLSDEVLSKMVSCKLAKVYMTSTVAEVLMCSPKSVYPWDLTVFRDEDCVLIDLREDSNLAYVTVGETSPDPPPEDPGINGAKNLNIEATLINLRLKRHFLKAGKKFALPHKHPSPLNNYSDDESDEPKSDPAIGFRYRIFDLGSMSVMIRCQVDGVLQGSKKKAKFVNVHALNETICKGPNFGDWRSKLDTQKGAIVANELKGNSFKLSRWTCGAILSGVDQMKFGFVSRISPKENKKHVILGTQQFLPNDFAQQINFSIDNGFGILKCILDHLLRLPMGKYILMKDPNKPIIRILSTSSRLNSSQEESSEDEKPAENDLLVDEAKLKKSNLIKKAENRLAKINESLGTSKWSTLTTPF